MQEKPKNRDWVKNAAIIFLAVLLVLTFFSNTIMNRSLPEVATQEVTSGSIVARVRGSGIVTANSNTQVKMEKTRVIRSVLVKVGQQVEAGDVLFTLGEGSSEEIEAAETALRNLQASYNRTAASMPYHNYTTQERKLNNLKTAYDEAKKAEARAKDAAEKSTTKDEMVEKATASLAAAEKKREAAEALYEKALENAKGQNIDETLNELQARQEEILLLLYWNPPFDKQGNQNIYYVEGFEYDNNHLICQNVWDDQYLIGREKIERQITLTERRIQELKAKIPVPTSPVTGEEWNEKAGEDSEALNNEATMTNMSVPTFFTEAPTVTAATTMMLTTEPEATLTVEPTVAPTVEPTVAPTVEPTVAPTVEPTVAPTVEPTVTPTLETEEELEKRELQLIKLNSAYEDYTTLQNKIDSLWSEESLEEIRLAYENAVLDVERWKTALDTYLTSSKTPETVAYKEAVAARKAAEDAYLTAQENLADQKAYDARSDTGTFIDLSNTQADIEVARKKLADLTGGEEAQILARVAGTIQTIECSPGDTKKKDDILCTIEAPDMGYSLSFSVTNDQANRLRIGDTATVSNFYWGTEITATLNSIKIDPKNPQSNKLLTFDLSGNVTAGSELTLSVGQKSANYDIIIPSSAIRTDANGSFVLKVEAKNSPLGNRYTARRVPVEILASDDSNSAVSADLGFGDYVITTSSVPIKNGELVRLATA